VARIPQVEAVSTETGMSMAGKKSVVKATDWVIYGVIIVVGLAGVFIKQSSRPVGWTLMAVALIALVCWGAFVKRRQSTAPNGEFHDPTSPYK